MRPPSCGCLAEMQTCADGDHDSANSKNTFGDVLLMPSSGVSAAASLTAGVICREPNPRTKPVSVFFSGIKKFLGMSLSSLETILVMESIQ